MSLTNEQYSAIRRKYDERIVFHQRELEARKEEIYSKIPEYEALEKKIIEISMERGKSLLSKNSSDFSNDEYHKKILDIKLEKNRLLEANGYPKDYLELQYDCINCKDTGYVDGQKCFCFAKYQIDTIYNFSQMTDLIRTDNFETLSRNYYEGDALARFDDAVETCKNFVRNFNSDYHNLLFYGTVGTGKTFLSSCVANELLKKGNSIIYVSAVQLFQTISNHIFSNDKEIFMQISDALLTCDLLIIDDLGTESTNDFTRSRLFDLVNERCLRRKSLIISTNLSLEDIRTRYSDRVFSRIYSNFERIHLYGTKDIRIQKRLEECDD